MPQYEIRAIDAQQQVRTLLLAAQGLQELNDKLAARGLRALSQRERRATLSRLSPSHKARFALVLFAQELHALVAAGLSVIEAVEALGEKESHGPSRQVLLRLQADLRAGLKLSTAMGSQPEVFPPLIVGLVRACEGTSSLAEGLGRYVEYQTRLHGVRSRLISAAVYPAILLVVGFAVALFLMGYVVPRFAGVYEDMGRPMPWASAVLLGAGRFVGEHPAALGAGVLAALACAVAASMVARRSGAWGRWVRRWPWIGERVHIIELTRLYLTLGLLLEGGLPIAGALSLAKAVSSAQTRTRLGAALQLVEEGRSLTSALDAQALVTPVGMRLLRVGEASGSLGPMLRHVAQLHDEETARWFERVSRAVEPLMMLSMGLVIGGVVLLLYMPIFDLAGSLQ